MNKIILFLLIICFSFLQINTANAKEVVDIHSHIITSDYLDILKNHNAQLEETFPLPQWNVEKHLNFMKNAGIKYSIISLPAPQPYYNDIDETKKFIRKINEESFKIKEQYPNKFKFFATLPLPDVDAAIEEAIYALDVLHADGIKLATNSRGQYLGDKALDPLMKILNERNAIIFIHPHRPTPYSKEIITNTPLPMYEYTAETTRTVLNMVSRNIMVRYPNIKVIVPHAGSFLPLAIPRYKSIYPVIRKNNLIEDVDVEKNLAKVYYDLAGNPSIDIIKTLLTITTPSHIMYGSDFPYQPSEILERNLNNLSEALKKDKKLSKYKDDFLWKNADNLFNNKGDKQ